MSEYRREKSKGERREKREGRREEGRREERREKRDIGERERERERERRERERERERESPARYANCPTHSGQEDPKGWSYFRQRRKAAQQRSSSNSKKKEKKRARKVRTCVFCQVSIGNDFALFLCDQGAHVMHFAV